MRINKYSIIFYKFIGWLTDKLMDVYAHKILFLYCFFIFFTQKTMNSRKSAADLLREKYMSTHLKKTANEKIHPDLSDLHGLEYLKSDIHSKMYNPLFNIERYTEIGSRPPRCLLIRGINGVGKTYITSCFCQQYQIPLITSFIETSKDIKELFNRSKTTERSVILIKNVESILKEDNLIHQLNESIRTIDWNVLVVLTNTDTLDKIQYDSEIFVKIPTVFGRKEILEGLLKNMKTNGVDTFKIAQNTPGFVARDLVKLISMVSTRVVSKSNMIKLKSIETNDTNNNSNKPSSTATVTATGIPSPTTGIPTTTTTQITMEDFIASIKEWKNITQNITFDDIGALDSVKEELTMSILLPSRFPEKFAAFGINKPSGILLHGPPGCGKTLIAKAVSNMSHCNFLSIKGPELITKYVGDSEKHLRDLFQKAKNLNPCVLFFDEIDSLCGKRGTNEFGNRIVNQILTLLDGMEDRGEVYLIGATNRIDSIDGALMRPGRFDKIIEVSLPSRTEGLEIFRKCILKVPYEEFDFESLDFTGFSGADIAGTVKEAAMLCLKENFEVEDLKITEKYFRQAIEKMKNMKKTQ